MKTQLHPLVEQLIKLGVTITIGYDKEHDRFTYDLNTGAKSSMNAYATVGGTLFLEMRYGETAEIETFDELCEAFDSCVYHSFCNHEWVDAMVTCGHWPDSKYRPNQ